MIRGYRWQELGSCTGQTGLFFAPQVETRTARAAHKAAALALCQRCPVLAACGITGRRGEEAGIWGGETQAQREREAARVASGRAA